MKGGWKIKKTRALLLKNLISSLFSSLGFGFNTIHYSRAHSLQIFFSFPPKHSSVQIQNSKLGNRHLWNHNHSLFSLFFFFSVKLFHRIPDWAHKFWPSLRFCGTWMGVRWILPTSTSPTLPSPSVPAKKDPSWLQSACTKFGKEVM